MAERVVGSCGLPVSLNVLAAAADKLIAEHGKGLLMRQRGTVMEFFLLVPDQVAVGEDKSQITSHKSHESK